ncbi:MAG: hypothetical protein AAGD00_06185 [Planctomycetota bacterium]
MALTSGLASERAFADVVFTAVLAMGACQLIGLLGAAAARVAVREGLLAYERANPIPNSDIELADMLPGMGQSESLAAQESSENMAIDR